MDDKRRRARVQGAWAGKAKATAHIGPRVTVATGKPQGWGHDHVIPDKQFVYKEPTEVVRKIPEPRIIDKPGTYEISTSASGVSRALFRLRMYGSDVIAAWPMRRPEHENPKGRPVKIWKPGHSVPLEGFVLRLRLFPSFIEPKEAEWMFEQLYRENPWRQKSNVGPDGPYQEPRLTCWYGEVPYTYSKSTMQANPHWHPLLTMLKDRIEEVTAYSFNSLLCNLYRHDKDSIDWHSDDEPDLGKNPTIASLSFGETRVFQMRKKPPPEEQGDYTYVERIHVPLDGGTLLIMEGATQSDWQHRVPKEYHDRRPRINLTFRTMFPVTKT